MNEQNENKIDQFFRDGLANAENQNDFREGDWNEMEALLDERSRKRGLLYRMYAVAGSIAAMILIALGLFLFKPVIEKDEHPKKQTITKLLKPTGISGRSGKQPTGHIPINSLSANKGITNKKGFSRESKSFFALSAPKNDRRHTGNSRDSLNQRLAANNNPAVNNAVTATDTAALGSSTNKLATVQPPVSQSQQADTSATVPDNISKPVKKDKTKLKPVAGARFPKYTLSLLAAPDLNGVSSFNHGQVGTNAGLQFSMQLSKKWSITTGVGYAAKPYQSVTNDYFLEAAYNGAPATIVANCKVLDIPLNINYQFYNKGKNSFSAGTGLSSYFMLREHYRFDYVDNTSFNLNVANKNKHPFGVMNLNATYQRQINSKFNIQVQPYLKLPLTHIGQERVDLQSTGVAVGVGWNLNSSKPK